MAELWTPEEVDEYCRLFQLWRKAMLDAGYELDDFRLTINKKEKE